MENVVAFNAELFGLYEAKPPISKAKMAAITKAAMRAIKFYKHVVQSVEKFILKCKPEYKVPGLYVIDSIVRQSRHQFGVEKDVFAPRFARNMKDTFANLFRCAPEDKSRIIRVLNLWQKNNVFAPDVIQPIFDLADPSHPIYQMPPQMGSGGGDVSVNSNGLNISSAQLDVSTSSVSGTIPSLQSGGDDKLVMPDLSMGHPKTQTNALDQNTIRQLQQIQQLLLRQTASENASATSSGATMSHSDSNKFNKKFLDYDYGDEEEEEKKCTSPPLPNFLDNNNLKQLLKDPNVLRQLQTLQNFQKFKQQQEEKQIKLNELRLQEEAFDKHIQNVLKGSSGVDAVDISGKEVEFVSEESKIEVINLDGNDSRSPSPDRDRYKRRRSRSRSRSRDRAPIRERRRRSRSRSRSRSPRTTNRRRASRERERERDRTNDRPSERNRDKDKEKEREHERERRRKGLPDIKKEHLSVCSTTLWVGHLSKLVYQEELSDTFGKYGDIVSIDQIVPRGCAFIVMNRRQDASKAMSSLKNHKLQGRAITISWAAGKGVKSKEWKDFWDLELGVTYIPWNKLDKDTDLDALEEGGMFDEDSMPDWMKDKINKLKNKDNVGTELMFGIDGMPKIDTTQPPPQAGGIMSMPPFGIAPPMGAPPRLLPPMGVPMPGNMGIPMPQAMVPGMPPPHAMMMTPGMLPPPGYPPIPHLDKNVPPPNMRSDGQNINMPPAPFMGNPALMQPMSLPTPPHFQQPPNTGGNASSDDQMDIEMEDEMGTDIPSQHVPQINFNQPPPIFQGGSSAGVFPDGSTPKEGNEDFGNNRERNRGGNSRWSTRDDKDQSRGNRMDDGADRDMWRDNRNNMQASGPTNFNDTRRSGAPANIPPYDMNNQSQRGEFFDMRHGNGGGDDFGDRHGGGPQRGGDFFPNMQNRFNQPNSLMQMRIQPPGVFNNRMNGPGMGGGPGMFMRGQGPRPQGGFNFNDRPPFDRENESGNRMRGGRGMNDRRGGRGGGRGGLNNNWRDIDDEDGSVFKRRMGNNRFGGRDRDGPEENRISRDRDRSVGGRRPMNDRRELDRTSRDRRDGGADRLQRNRTNSGDNFEDTSSKFKQTTGLKESSKATSNVPLDTEEDWDQELSEHNFDSGEKVSSSPPQEYNNVPEEDKSFEFSNETESKGFTSESTQKEDQPPKIEEKNNFISTPLYDEPAPNNTKAEVEPIEINIEKSCEESAPEPQENKAEE